jgi:hypothetical protein
MSSLANCGTDYFFIGFAYEVHNNSRVVRIFGKKLVDKEGHFVGFGHYYIADDIHPYERIQLPSGITNLKTDQKICLPGYSFPFKVTIYDKPKVMYCC